MDVPQSELEQALSSQAGLRSPASVGSRVGLAAAAAAAHEESRGSQPSDIGVFFTTCSCQCGGQEVVQQVGSVRQTSASHISHLVQLAAALRLKGM
jgi:hypothetical protein